MILRYRTCRTRGSRLAVLWVFLATISTTAAAQESLGPMRFDWRIAAVDGARMPLAAFQGEVLFLNVWATWCAPCVAELPSIEALYDQYASRGVRFLAVAADRPGAVQRFQRRHRIGLPLYLEVDAIPRELGISAVPTTLIVDRSGQVVLRHRGFADWDRPEVRAFLDALLGPVPGAGGEVP